MFLAVFVAVLLPIVALSWFISLVYASLNSDFHIPPAWQWLVSFLIPILVALYGLRKKSLSPSGAVAGLIVGFLLTISCMRFLMSLLSFFILSSKATKFRASRKRKIEADFKEGGQRNWVQVVSNGGPAAILAVFYMWEVGSIDVPVDFTKSFAASWYAVSVMSALASSNGDTFASEIGTAIGNTDPIHVLNWKRVPRGTNGGISLAGSLGSLLGGLLVGLAFYITELLTVPWVILLESPPQWPLIFYGALAGFLGSMIDSVLGATLQYSGKHKKLGCIVEYKGPDVQHISGREILDNHSVNLISSLLTGLLMPHIATKIWTGFV